MDDAGIKAEILKRTVKEEGRLKLSCAQALLVASGTGAAPSKIGEICDREGIKIFDCQLGCFGTGRKKHG